MLVLKEQLFAVGGKPKPKATMGFQSVSPRISPKISPKASPTKPSPKQKITLQYLFDIETKPPPYIVSNLSSPSNIGRRHSSPVVDTEYEEFTSAISFCNKIFTFTDPTESPSQQDLKRLKLIQLLFLIKSSEKPLQGKLLAPLMSMVSANLFRPLPPPSCASNTLADLPDDEEVASTFTPIWPHLQVVYDILLRLVLNVDPKSLRDYIDSHFILSLLCLFHSEDPRERESLKNVFHRIYSKFTFHRSFMRKAMNDVFLYHVFETEKHCGIGELLEIWGSIINGFAVPLKEEHKLFLMRVLLPLHKARGLQVFHRPLAYCVSQFVQKEPALGGLVVRGILRYWPMANCQKEVLLIGELEELVENLDPEQYRKLALPLCKHITRCLESCNSQVAERALYVWNNEQFVKMASSAMEEVFPVVVEGMESNLKMHWSKSVKQLTENVKAMLEEMDPTLYQRCLQEIELRKSKALQEEIKRKQRWDRIEMAAKQNQSLQKHQPKYISVRWH